uniref:YTH domain-containing protein n=1 Tax=Clytia hemisphaerica TaxID=252671 RepID=A0A7M5X6Z6_9CNID
MDSSEIKVKIEPESEGMISEEQQEAKEDTSMENPVEGNFDIPLDEKILEAEQPDEAPPSEDTILDEQATNADEAVVKKEETEETSKEEAQPEAVVDQEMSQESTASIEPGELPVQNEGQVSQDTDMNVLEAILGDGDEAKDDFDNEIANTNSAKKVKAATATPKTRKTPKRKTKKPTKAAAAKNGTASPVSKIESASANNATPDAPKDEIKPSPAKKAKLKTTAPASTTDNVVSDATTKDSSAVATTTTPGKKAATKTQKKKKVATKAAVKKETKKPDTETNAQPTEAEKEAELEKKVKELEKIVKSAPVVAPTADESKTDATKVKKDKAPKASPATRKRKASDSALNTSKTKANTSVSEEKPLEEEVEEQEEEAIEDEEFLDEENILNEEEDEEEDADMKVVDGFSDHDGSVSDHGSSFSYSRSRSLSGSFSVELSNFSGSSSLDDLEDDGEGDEKKKTKRKKKHPSDEKHKELVDQMLKGARYFIIKSNNYENVSLSKAKGVWATPPANERKLNDAFKHSTNVVLVFSVKESGRFQGFARLASESRHDGIPVPWVLPPGFDRRILGGTFKVDWLNRKEVTFSKCANLRNPWNENKEVKICRDGQELEPSVGEVLCRMFEDDLTINLERIQRHAKRYKSGGGDHKPDRLPSCAFITNLIYYFNKNELLMRNFIT